MTNLEKISTANDMLWSTLLCLAVFFSIMFLPEMALAGGTLDNPMGNVLCKIVRWLTGTTGRALATIAIVIIGIGALMGKVSWGMAIIVAMGIAIVFGASTIVTLLGGGSTDACATASA